MSILKQTAKGISAFVVVEILDLTASGNIIII
jgi:hypothetical protein